MLQEVEKRKEQRNKNRTQAWKDTESDSLDSI